jgi:hypothetical protein
MKITKNKLKQLIKEELEAVMREVSGVPVADDKMPPLYHAIVGKKHMLRGWSHSAIQEDLHGALMELLGAALNVGWKGKGADNFGQKDKKKIVKIALPKVAAAHSKADRLNLKRSKHQQKAIQIIEMMVPDGPRAADLAATGLGRQLGLNPDGGDYIDTRPDDGTSL